MGHRGVIVFASQVVYLHRPGSCIFLAGTLAAHLATVYTRTTYLGTTLVYIYAGIILLLVNDFPY